MHWLGREMIEGRMSATRKPVASQRSKDFASRLLHTYWCKVKVNLRKEGGFTPFAYRQRRNYHAPLLA